MHMVLPSNMYDGIRPLSYDKRPLGETRRTPSLKKTYQLKGIGIRLGRYEYNGFRPVYVNDTQFLNSSKTGVPFKLRPHGLDMAIMHSWGQFLAHVYSVPLRRVFPCDKLASD